MDGNPKGEMNNLAIWEIWMLIFIKNLVMEEQQVEETSLRCRVYGEMLVPRMMEFGASLFRLRAKWEELL